MLFFGLKCTRIRLAAELRPDPLGSLSAPQDPLAAIRGKAPPPGTERRGRGREYIEEWRDREGRTWG